MTALIAVIDHEQWTSCLFKNEIFGFPLIFSALSPPAESSISNGDGVCDIFPCVRDGAARNVGFYEDPRGGGWMLRETAGRFPFINFLITKSFTAWLGECRKSSA